MSSECSACQGTGELYIYRMEDGLQRYIEDCKECNGLGIIYEGEE